MEPLAWLFGLEYFGIKLGVDNINILLEALGHPERSFRSVHIAGTNGKGSVTAMVDAALVAAGHRSARYTSPHLVSITERFVVSGDPVSEGALAEAVSHLRTIVDALRSRGTLEVDPTFFEVTTAAAFELFRRFAVDVAVCEVGLGGRLDATNVLMPEVTAITTIGFDHQQHLGSTLEAIAAEKAGIIKPHVPVVIGRLPPAALNVVAAAARRADAPLVAACDAETLERVGRMTIGLRGRHQQFNAAVALHVLEQLNRRGIPAPPEAVREGLANVRWAGRLEWRQRADGREALLDAAHNPEGAAALAGYLHEHGERLPLVFAAMRDKDTTGILRALAPEVSAIVCTRASNPRAAAPAELAAAARAINPRIEVTAVDSPADALEYAWRLSRRIVVAGSIFLLGDVIQIAWSPDTP
jgi:dihydrofolate synthase/folylpolyglutamate synthase